MRDNKSKRILKTEPRFKISLNEEQKQAKTKFYEHDVNFLHGDFGSGKTLLACEIALSSFRKKQFNKIIITRPVVRNDVGYLPGGIDEKFEPLVAPIIHNFNMLQPVQITDKMLANKDIEILPISFAKGITYVDSVVIIDEYQDITYEDFRLMLSRLGRDSKIIFCGSKEQIEKKIGEYSCIYETMKLKDSGIVGYKTLKSNHRHEDITKVLDYLNEHKNEEYKSSIAEY